ncbi:MAG: chemotaxis protein CheW [Stygiobacter sp. RIFOXYC12_FULL_38_8]|nr:MAG: chemotaxis protein CheW [Stygiobacter sp. GWC2_38_9]OGV09045.1 MAG: chemotaxis protein CheW [Stygiobacter sp. RIFOXYB2_FULL_37_11]OGV14140.1 MAG: chemotaxis protein CheW [Stygiobacter sp. RIFOXYA2_FULL_38_8]OGV16271.1 MAG: chemotaxis protein CheW [Stygiobacter sp. RIFOXYC2_FULL_38_25]OGV28624.1 MAG: chemotaxis protein CheW [Stygiobacter sp. RIFOXYC12_FULL_38_8]OGV81636.1 MAG: chemotaxis protein CheW [Stygiobacter sp. GWF2_38_21]
MHNIDISDIDKIVLFNLDDIKYAFQLSAVERVVSSVEITPLPKAPDIVLGIVNYQGLIIPVIDIRKRFRLPTKELSLEAQFVIAKTSKRLIVIVVDSVSGVYELGKSQIVDSAEAFPYTVYLSGISKIDSNIVLITDLEKFLTNEEEKILGEIV